MKIKSVIVSLLAVLMLMSACTLWAPDPVVRQFNKEELDILKSVIQQHNDGLNNLKERDYDPEIKIVRASSFVMQDTANKISALMDIKTSHDDYIGEIPLGHYVYGPIVFDESTLYGEGDSMFLVAFIDGSNENYNVLECSNATLERGRLNVDIEIFISTDEVPDTKTPTFIVIEFEGCKAEDIKSAQLTFDPHTEKGRTGRVLKKLGTADISIMSELLEKQNERNSLDIKPSDLSVKAVNAFSVSYPNNDELSKFYSLSASAQYHDDYTGKITLTHPVYGPIVFNKSLIDPGADGVYFVISIDAPFIDFGVTECLGVTLEDGCLKVDLELFTSRWEAYAFITDFTIVEIEGCKAEDIESVVLEFIPMKPE